MNNILFRDGEFTRSEARIVGEGFDRHTMALTAPPYDRTVKVWISYDDHGKLIGAAEAHLLWDWLYIDQVWTDESSRSTGLGRQLMNEMERYGQDKNLVGLWLWTQSWQAEGFYKKLGYKEFAVFDDFPRGHKRIGLRKEFAAK